MSKITQAIKLIKKYCPPSEAHSKKQMLPHVTRVGEYLQENGYSEDIVLAGYLHDMIEWSDINPQIISDQFGPRVLEIIQANSKDRSIDDKDERIQDLCRRCAELGKDALIVKAADTLDSFKHYTKTQNQPELEYCAKNAAAVLRYKTEDKIFKELEEYA